MRLLFTASAVALVACAGRPIREAPAPAAQIQQVSPPETAPPMDCGDGSAMEQQFWAARDAVGRQQPRLKLSERRAVSLSPGQVLPLTVDRTAENYFLLLSAAPLALSAQPARLAPQWLSRLPGVTMTQLVVRLGPTEEGFTVRGVACVGVLRFVEPNRRLREGAGGDGAPRSTCETMAAACEKKGCFVSVVQQCPGGRPPEPDDEQPPQCACVCGAPVATNPQCPRVP